MSDKIKELVEKIKDLSKTEYYGIKISEEILLFLIVKQGDYVIGHQTKFIQQIQKEKNYFYWRKLILIKIKWIHLYQKMEYYNFLYMMMM